MRKKLTMLAVVPGDASYTAYFYNPSQRVVIPVSVLNNCVHDLMKIEQSLLFSLYSLFVPESNIKVNVKVELEMDEVIVNTLGIKVSKELLDNSIFNAKI